MNYSNEITCFVSSTSAFSSSGVCSALYLASVTRSSIFAVLRFKYLSILRRESSSASSSLVNAYLRLKYCLKKSRKSKCSCATSFFWSFCLLMLFNCLTAVVRSFCFLSAVVFCSFFLKNILSGFHMFVYTPKARSVYKNFFC